MDSKLRAMLVSEMRDIMQNIMEGSEEKWLSGEQLTKQFAFFSKSWLKTYGHTLPRTQAVVTASDGEHKTGWCYPLHKIQRMVSDGSIKNLKAI